VAISSNTRLPIWLDHGHTLVDTKSTDNVAHDDSGLPRARLIQSILSTLQFRASRRHRLPSETGRALDSSVRVEPSARLILSQAGSHVCRRALHHPPLQVFIPGKVLGSECAEVQFHCWRSLHLARTSLGNRPDKCARGCCVSGARPRQCSFFLFTAEAIV